MSKPGDPTRPGDGHDRTLTRLEKALGEALARYEAAEAVVEDQRQRLKALGQGREDTMRALAETRAELKRVSQERDDLRKQLMRLDNVQAATIALPDDHLDPSPPPLGVPSLEDLMSALGQIEEPPGAAHHLQLEVPRERDIEGSEEMISPLLVFPEQFAETASSDSAQDATARVLELLDSERPVKYPLHKETMTIGRADIADIQIDNGFLSRLHARVVSTPDGVMIEDIESKNGIRVNAKITPRQALRHGDVVDLGVLRFRFIDTAFDEAE